jgi:hypothetical protein
MFRYAIILRSMTSGRGTFTMAYDHYEDVPAEISKKVIAAHKQEDEEEIAPVFRRQATNVKGPEAAMLPGPFVSISPAVFPLPGRGRHPAAHRSRM